jgi:kinesin family protein 5
LGGGLKVFEDKERGVYVGGATEVRIAEAVEIFCVLKRGQSNRAVGATGMNENSSRSHSIFILMLEQRNKEDLTEKTGKLYLVDLAGSEKVKKTHSSGLRLDEAKTINKSLSALGNVINALTSGDSGSSRQAHIPVP